MAHEGRPRYLQIAEDLRALIDTGTLPAGARMPSEAELIERFHAAQGTVRKAMAELRATGLVETHHGKGTFVRSTPPVRRKSSDRFRRSHRRAGKAAYLAEAEQAGSFPTVVMIHVGPVPAPPDMARRLGVGAGETVLARRRRYLSDGVPTEEATSYIPWDIAQGVPELSLDNPGPGGIYARFEENGFELQEYVEEITVRVSSRDEAGALALGTGSPVIRLVREAHTQSGRIAEVCDTIMAANRFVLEYRIPAGQ